MAGALSHVKEFNKDYSFICHNAVTHKHYIFKIIFYVYVDFLLLKQRYPTYTTNLPHFLFYDILCFALSVGNSDWNFNRCNIKLFF